MRSHLSTNLPKFSALFWASVSAEGGVSQQLPVELEQLEVLEAPYLCHGPAHHGALCLFRCPLDFLVEAQELPQPRPPRRPLVEAQEEVPLQEDGPRQKAQDRIPT